MNIENLPESWILLNFTPLKWSNVRNTWDTDGHFSEAFKLAYLCPLGYREGEISLQVVESLAVAKSIASSCQSFDGGGYVISCAVPKVEGRERGGSKGDGPKWGLPLEVPVEVSNVLR